MRFPHGFVKAALSQKLFVRSKRVNRSVLYHVNHVRVAYRAKTVRDYNAGEAIYGAAEDVQRMVGDYVIHRVDNTKRVVAKTTFPKIGTEISIQPGVELVPVVRGNDGKRGYIWSFPTQLITVEFEGELYTLQVYGLKTLIRQLYPELEPQFSGKPMMDYIDGVTLAASIPQTHALLKKHMREEKMAEKAGLGSFNGLFE